MTIYAIVNDLLSDNCKALAPVWTLVSPAAILQGGNPYFVPDFAERFEARIALAVRIGKLGKGIATRFASRYIDAVAPAAMMVPTDRLEELRREGLPWASAISYDRSLAIGKFRPTDFSRIPAMECSLTIESFSDGAREEISIAPAGSGPSPEEIIASISQDNTLKTGDIILIGLAGSGPQVMPDLRARLSLDGELALRWNIR